MRKTGLNYPASPRCRSVGNDMTSLSPQMRRNNFRLISGPGVVVMSKLFES